ncbi:D-alanine--D-alanine ligase [Desulfonema ishimotonii]|uniref:D-alanine--D-alanine ligase n=1 Tax=Desulfonema ishimotonii TaxID=45657 RepID=A0A401G1B9_9BACT|nr:D-alanine--D-alanine ligase [Desulfonema ishimotonii]GBC62983.1 D-alanine--D-alanine ligase [Desulfonema ishimotonii]
MKKLNIALIYGGISSEREVSLKGGTQVSEALDKTRYQVFRYDPMTDLNRLMADAPKIDAALIILHGPYGEDGTIQGMLELLDIPYQGSGVLGSALAMNKLASKRLYEQAGLPVPPWLHVRQEAASDPAAYMATLGLPIVVKPVSGGSSIGMSIVRTEDRLADALENAFSHDDSVLLESCIEGVEITAGVIGNEQPDPLPLIEIIPDASYDFFDYEAKYKPGATREICPARIDAGLTEKCQAYARIAHSALFCKGYSRTDFILKDREFYVLETNTIPGMTPTSLLPLAAKTAGIGFSQLLDRLIELCLEDHRKRKRIKTEDRSVPD